MPEGSSSSVCAGAGAGTQWSGRLLRTAASRCSSLLVDDDGSQLTLAHTTGNEGQIFVASSGRGDMTVRNGGAVNAFTLGVGNGWELDSQGSVTLDGTGSTLTLDGVDWHRLSINRGSVTVSGGALLNAAACTNAQLILGQNGGTQRLLISGAGAKLSYADTLNGGLWIGRSGATANLSVANGGAIEGVNLIQVGNTGAVASFNVSGPLSSITYGSSVADLFVGRGAVGVADNANTFNPTVNIGWSSNGVLAIRDGAALRIEGLAPTGPELFFEGAGVIAGNGWGAPSSGRIEVSGPGSKLETLGSNPFITVGGGA